MNKLKFIPTERSVRLQGLLDANQARFPLIANDSNRLFDCTQTFLVKFVFLLMDFSAIKVFLWPEFIHASLNIILISYLLNNQLLYSLFYYR